MRDWIRPRPSSVRSARSPAPPIEPRSRWPRRRRSSRLACRRQHCRGRAMTAPIHLRATAFTHQGVVRPGNEDTIAVGDWIRRLPMAAPAVLEHQIAAPLICLVADGMGGHAAGEVASRAVAEHLSRRAVEAVDEAAMAALLCDADAELRALMREHPAWRGMGTTVAGIGVSPEHAIAFNIGDSRVYRIHGGR